MRARVHVQRRLEAFSQHPVVVLHLRKYLEMEGVMEGEVELEMEMGREVEQGMEGEMELEVKGARERRERERGA